MHTKISLSMIFLSLLTILGGIAIVTHSFWFQNRNGGVPTLVEPAITTEEQSSPVPCAIGPYVAVATSSGIQKKGELRSATHSSELSRNER